MTFQIVDIIIDKCVDGRTRIFAVAQDNERTDVLASYSNHEYIDLTPKSVGILLNKSYNEILNSKKKQIVKLGDIVGGE